MPNFTVADPKLVELLTTTQICNICKIRKDNSEFHIYKRRGTTQLQATCKACHIAYNIKWREENNETFNASRRENRKENLEYFRAQEKGWNQELREEFIKAYGSCCNCCGEDNPRFLSIDHIDGKGKEHRLELRGKDRGGNTNSVLRELRRRGWPKDNYQLLCYNCNFGKAQNNNICPHIEVHRRLLNVA